MEDLALKLLSQYGFGVFMAIIMAAFFGLVLRWTLKRTDTTLEQSNTREKDLLSIIEGYKEELASNTRASLLHQDEARSAHEFQRAEHTKMITLLDSIVTRQAEMNVRLENRG